MAKTTTLKERGTGAVIYPQTIPSQVIFPDGTDLNDALESQSNVTGVPTEKRIEAIEPTLVTEALRKVPQSLTPEEQVQVKDNLGISKMELFCDMFNAAAGTDGYACIVDGEFVCKLNDVPLTYEEALLIYKESPTAYAPYCCQDSKIRTCFRLSRQQVNSSAKEISAFEGCLRLEVVKADSTVCLSADNTFYGCRMLRKILHPIQRDTPLSKNFFHGCVRLEYVIIIIKGGSNYWLDSSPLISLESFTYLVKHKGTDSAVNVYVHPNVYAKLTGDTTNAAAAALTEEELAQWMQIVTDAAAKKITFITTT